MDICHACGCFGHTFQQCEKHDDKISTSELPYDNWMEASPIRKRNYSDHKEEEEERKICQEFKGNLKASKGKMKLDFDNPNAQPSKNSKDGNGESSQKLILEKEVDPEVIDVRCSKRGRLEDVSHNKDGPLFYSNFDTPMLENQDPFSENFPMHMDKSMRESSQSEGAGIHNALSLQ